MRKSDPYKVVKCMQVTEKSMTLQNLKDSTSNRSVKRCLNPKYVFIVDKCANKTEIAEAIEQIYPDVEVVAVNTITLKPKPRRVRGRSGFRAGKKKAIVTLKEGDTLENI